MSIDTSSQQSVEWFHWENHRKPGIFRWHIGVFHGFPGRCRLKPSSEADVHQGWFPRHRWFALRRRWAFCWPWSCTWATVLDGCWRYMRHLVHQNDGALGIWYMMRIFTYMYWFTEFIHLSMYSWLSGNLCVQVSMSLCIHLFVFFVYYLYVYLYT